MGKIMELLKGLLGGNLNVDTLSKATGSQSNVETPSRFFGSQESRSQGTWAQQSRSQEYRPQPFTKKVRRTDAESAQFNEPQASSPQVKPSFPGKKQKV